MIRQINQQLNQKSTPESPQTEGDLNYNSVEEHSVSSITDTDYEFLFNQLLEGVAHGWHSVKIAKFFQRLGEKGQQKLWVAWLERYRGKIFAGSDLYQQQLGARMVRLGEISQSISSIQQIGSTAYNIGKEILYGRESNLVWEYDGPDLPLVAEEAVTEETVEHQATEIQNDNPNVASQASSSSSFAEAANWIQDAIAEFVELAETLGDETALTEAENNSEDNSSDSSSQTVGLDDRPEQQSEELLVAHSAEKQEEENLVETKPDLVKAEEENLVETEPNLVKAEEENLVGTEPDLVKAEEENLVGTEPDLVKAEEENLVGTEPNLVKATESESFPLAEEKVINLSWPQFIELIEQDDHLVEQIATQFNLTDKDPKSIIKAVTNQLNERESTSIDESSLKLVESWFDLGLKQASAGDLEEAIISWEKALELNPNLAEAWHNRGSALGRLGNYPEALESFEQTLKIDPHNAQAWNERGHVLYQLKQWQEAVDSWEQAIAIISNNYQFWYNRGCALEELQKYQEAIASYEKALEIKPDFQEARARYTSILANRHPIN